MSGRPSHTILSVLADHTRTFIAALAAIAVAALSALARNQIQAAIKWAFAPITRIFPWNKDSTSLPETRESLISEYSLVDLFLRDANGELARYQKLSNFFVCSDDFTSYKEGVSAEGYASNFSTMRGVIAQTAIEHGFCISQIDLNEALQGGSRFTNLYVADLHNCFTKPLEHWTQEIAFRTAHLTLQVHFPEDRPPILVRCKILDGMTDKAPTTTAKIVDLFGKKSVVWEMEHPPVKQILKLEWIW